MANRSLNSMNLETLENIFKSKLAQMKELAEKFFNAVMAKEEIILRDHYYIA